MLNKLLNLFVIIPVAAIMLVAAGFVAELSHAIHRLTGWPFFSSVVAAAAVLVAAVLFVVSIWRIVRRWLNTVYDYEDYF